MVDDPVRRADEAFARALEATGARDPREYYRKQMAELKQASPEAFAAARDYYAGVLVPAVADGREDPIQAWLEFGRRLAEWSGPGETVLVDGTGVAHPWSRPVPLDHLVLHLPEGRGGKALAVGIPAQPTAAQRATFDLLVAMKRELS